MKRFLPLLILPLLIWVACEEKKSEEESEEEIDTTPPTVTITYPQTGSTVNEIITITCMSSDNEGVEKVELWVNGVTTGLTDNTEPYSFDWNTNTLENGNFTIIVRSYDTNDNTTDSQPIVLTVDNTQSNPQSVNITSLVFEIGGFNITWNPSTDGDFSSYDLEKSVESSMNNYTVVYSTDEVGNTNYLDTDVDPLVYLYYRVTVSDTFGYQSKGEIYSSSLDPLPNSVNVESVDYTLEEMSVSWGESSDGDFKHYKLLQSETESGGRDTVVTIMEKSTTSHYITNFDPTHENWFWVEVSDTLGQTSIGNGMTNSIDSEPSQIDVISVTYDFESMTVTWKQSSDNDFVSYELLNSESEDGEYTSIVVIDDIGDTSYSFINNMFFDPTQENWFKVKVTDFWNLTSIGSGMTNEIDTPPTPSELYPIVYEDGSFIITWSQNNDDDFQSYTLYESMSENMSGEILIYESNSVTDTSHVLTNISVNETRYYQVVVSDIWGLTSPSSVMIGSSNQKIWFLTGDLNFPRLYKMNIDGEDHTEVIDIGGIFDYDFSSDGSKVLLLGGSEEDVEKEIYIMDENGNNLNSLTNNSVHERYPQISPDDSKIVFCHDGDGDFEIYSMDLEGENVTQLTDNNDKDFTPSFSPDGSQIVYKQGLSGGVVVVMDSDGGNQIPLTSGSYPQFFPDGIRILFNSDGNYYTIDVDGNNQNQLTENGNDNYGGRSVDISPDESKIVFMSWRDEGYNIYIMDSDGSNQTRLTFEGDNFDPIFSPEGNKIVYRYNWMIYIMDLDGNNKTNLSGGLSNCKYPQFQPQP